MNETEDGVRYSDVEHSYFIQRGLTRYAGVWSLWALGVGAVISGHFSGWNLGLAVGGWGGMVVAASLIMLMYIGLTFSMAEMSAALPHTGAAYSFARTSMGPWVGFLAGLAENVEYVLTPAVIVYFLSAYLSNIFETPIDFQPLWWISCYAIFLYFNVRGTELSFKITLVVTIAALSCLIVFWIFALPLSDISLWALNIDSNGELLAEGNGPFLPMGINGAFTALPFAVWLFLAIEQLPLAAEESLNPSRDIPRGILAGMTTLIVSMVMILWLNPSISGVGSYQLGTSGEPLLDGFKAIFGDQIAKILALVAVIGLIASFHTILFAKGRQIFSLSRAGYFPNWLSITHPKYKTPYIAMIAGALFALGVMLALWYLVGKETGGAYIGAVLINMAVFSAMLSYIMQSFSYILLRKNHPEIKRPYRSHLGYIGPILTITVALLTVWYQLQDEAFRIGIVGVLVWFVCCIIYFYIHSRHDLVMSPEEKFAKQQDSRI